MEENRPSIEENLEALQAILQSLESGDLSLSDSLKAFEQGVALVRVSNELLDEAEKKLKVLTGNGEQYDL